MSSSSTQPSNVCFNSNCKEVSELPRKGWRRRTGEFADLCDRCASAYEEGKFCETFHLNASGWRSCESCGKQIHCGCIVSFHTFVLLDAGGIECITCARKSFILTPNPAWPPPSDFLPLQPEGIKDSRSWTPIAGSGPVPWRQAPSLFNGSVIQTKLQPKTPYGDITGSIDRLHLNERPPVSSLVNKRKEENFGSLLNRTLKSCVSGRLENEHTVSSTPKKEASDRSKVFATHIQPTTLSPSVGKQSCSQNGTDSSGEAQMRNVRSRGDGGGKHQLLPRYWPRITDQELQQISGDTNSVITPLFEKMLSASDAGKIGRLVLPKKCAEAYFPPISHPEGLPLKVQDLKGQEWLFQFRFWPNNNSRMYVLEGVTPCMQSMQLQAGDIVTFSRIEPEGKLVMGCRKSSSTPSAHQGYGTSNSPIGVPTNGNASTKNIKPGEIVTKCSIKAKEVVETKPPVRSKRKNSTSNSKSKRLKVDCEELIELKLTVVQAQQLMRPSPNDTPTVIVIEGCDFEEYEQDAPIIGRPTIPSTGSLGEKIQWVQCEDCFKWRKIPDDALLPGRWTCSENLWDPDRSVCSAVEELTVECLADLVPTIGKAPKKMKASKQDMNSPDTIEGLDALANLAIQEEGEGVLASSSQATTKHPRHRPGCTCIVCIQPPSGKGPKHKQQCDCNVCKSVKRRFKTLMMKKGKKLSEKEAEAAANVNSPCSDAGAFSPTHEEPNSESCLDDTNDIIEKKSSPSPIKGEIDLNIKPEREDLSPRCDSGGVMRFLQDAAERFIWQQRGLPSSFANGNPVGHEVQDHVNLNNCGSDGSHQTSDADRHMALSIDNVSSVVHAEK
ncbi:PREDICTED: B3 domain-containing transcription repressor VAL2 isoform X4 [Ipomoea nil]|uniref:B3 domain-containing transcription repressor VAL2 isoform X4 n=1 Tax=Ipomoea nil TaxID=35883 RepID=UPI000900AD80|nr:PREDICTED: B3 domain-containing transcription repressor VAL2 isoform X4 [Ipomoea nil]